MTVIVGLVLLPILFMAQVVPPPIGQLALLLVVGTAYGAGAPDVPVPQPRLQSAPAEDCDCGVPSSPRGPR
jgi:hypothetical protein